MNKTLVPASFSYPMGSLGEEIEPEYRLYQGLWHCHLRGEEFHVLCGLGYTKEAAYADWQRMREKYA